MTEQLETDLHSEALPHNALLIQNGNSSAVGSSNGLQLNYESGNENEKPILLELGVNSNSTKISTEISSTAYPAHYPLDLQLNSAFDLVLPTCSSLNYNIDPDVLFHNPYTNRIPMAHTPPKTSSHSSGPSTLVALKSVPYPAHIPQTVYTWSTPTPVTSTSPTQRENKFSTEIVPPPVYITYADARDHTITKQTNHSWREKALQNEKDYKKTACDRERTRMRDMNLAFDQLRSKLPISKPNGKKYSKIESLRIAINYINHLQRLLNDNMTDQTFVATEQFGVKRRPTLYSFEKHKTNSFHDAKEKFESLDETHVDESTWSDGYIPNSQDKWD